jgi:hypothetical protein
VVLGEKGGEKMKTKRKPEPGLVHGKGEIKGTSCGREEWTDDDALITDDTSVHLGRDGH